jgi:hypothetical protein
VDDPIVSEVRRAREALLAEADYDLEKLSQRLRKEQITSGRRVVTRAARHPEDVDGKAA